MDMILGMELTGFAPNLKPNGTIFSDKMWFQQFSVKQVGKSILYYSLISSDSIKIQTSVQRY
jgi:hypothetical protein